MYHIYANTENHQDIEASYKADTAVLFGSSKEYSDVASDCSVICNDNLTVGMHQDIWKNIWITRELKGEPISHLYYDEDIDGMIAKSIICKESFLYGWGKKYSQSR